MTFSEMIRALRRGEFVIIVCGPNAEGIPSWLLESVNTGHIDTVPLPEGWVLPT